ncbi:MULTISPECIES: hypothetical protein [unclassified Novosphingobium]|uniref:hypothetical protein n=1 Tax=unclassified Novosphingobium TaxID=2644732 RepID=UPI0025F7BCAB|nr:MULTISPECIES: hypothetical protein [unclassified Novosphingobium]
MAKAHVMMAFEVPLFAASVPASAQGIGHTWLMRGSIIGIDYRGPIVCIGRVDGAEIGQVFKIYRPAPVYLRRRHAGQYRQKTVGHVSIDQIIDDHYAHVSVVDGEINMIDIIDL